MKLSASASIRIGTTASTLTLTPKYYTHFVDLIKDIRAEFGVANLPFVIATSGMANCDQDAAGLSLCSKRAAVANRVLARSRYSVTVHPKRRAKGLGHRGKERELL